MYVAVKGGQRAIENAHKLLEEVRRGDSTIPELSLDQVTEQLGLAVDRVMAEGSLYDRELAALAIKQAQGDLVEAAFLIRAYRTTLPRFGSTCPIDTRSMQIERRISATFKDLPGGQVLGPTYDYTHRLLDFSLARAGDSPTPLGHAPEAFDDRVEDSGREVVPRITELLEGEELIETVTCDGERSTADLTQNPLKLPASRDVRLQNLARGDEGFLLGLAYSAQRGFGFAGHPFVAEIRSGEVGVTIVPKEIGFPIEIGKIRITECLTFNRHDGSPGCAPKFLLGYGIAFGRNERKAIAMALVDRMLRSREIGEYIRYPAQDEEFVLLHSDNIEASGFVQHLKLPHYVDFQSELALMRQRREEFEKDENYNNGGETHEIEHRVVEGTARS